MMRFNSRELSCLAHQNSGRFDKEGVLFAKERQEGIFRKSEGFNLTCYPRSILVDALINYIYLFSVLFVIIFVCLAFVRFLIMVCSFDIYF